MNFDNKSIYAVNKKSEDIIYPFNDGEVVIIRKVLIEEEIKIIQIKRPIGLEAEINILSPGEMNASVFDESKHISDKDYHERECHDKRTARKSVSIDGIIETSLLSTESPEDILIEQEEEATNENIRTIENAMRIMAICLTETQKRRYLMHHLQGMSTRQIASVEGTNQKSIVESLQQAEKKIKIFSEKAKNTPSKQFKNGDK